MIGIIRAKSGNIGSIINALDFLNQKYLVIEDKSQIINLNKILLPGVGAFKNLKKDLVSLDLFDPLKEFIKNEKNHFLGICIGMQILLSKGTEDGDEEGFNYFNGVVKNLNEIKKVKVPNINWNKISIKKNCQIMQNYNKEDKFYFLHSYFCDLENKNEVIATSNYNGIEFPCIIQKNNIVGIQFHPEKSNQQGLNILKNFCKI